MRSFFQDDYVEYKQPYVIFKIEYFVPLLHSKLSGLKNSFTNRGHFSKMVILSTNNPMLSSKLNGLSHNSVPNYHIWKFPSQIGFFFKTIVFSTNNPILSSKLNILSHNSIPSGQIWKTPSQIGIICFQMIILSTNNPMLSSKLNFLSHNLFQIIRFWKFPSKTGFFFLRQSFWVPTTLCYLQNLTFHPIFLFISILFALHLHKPYFF